jgi:beta-glucanase (GH16 family)
MFLIALVGFLSLVDAGYIRVFNDPLDDLTNWVPQILSGADTGNNELEYYTDRPENVRTEQRDGANTLVITAKEETYKGYNYTSGRLTSR